jgi:hypothetical protein
VVQLSGIKFVKFMESRYLELAVNTPEVRFVPEIGQERIGVLIRKLTSVLRQEAYQMVAERRFRNDQVPVQEREGRSPTAWPGPAERPEKRNAMGRSFIARWMMGCGVSESTTRPG